MTAPRPTPIVCDVGALAPDAVAVEALARLQLNAKRQGVEVQFQHCSSELAALLDFCGLRDILSLDSTGSPAASNEKVDR